jgi:hypothetical protein
VALRNFWIESKIDGRKNKLAGGPKSRNGELSTVLYIRNNGFSEVAFKFTCKENDGSLSVKIFDKNNNLIYEHKTLR